MSDIQQTAVQIMKDFKAVQCSMKRRMQKYFKELELSVPQGMLLFMVSRHGSIKISDISEKLGLSNSTVSGIVDRLERQGYVERIRTPEDRRIVNVAVTGKIKKRIALHENVFESFLTEALMKISEKELYQVSEGMKILSEILVNNKGEDTLC